MRRHMPPVLNRALVPSSAPGLSRAHATLDRPTVSALCLTVSGPGGDDQALALRSKVENLVGCGLQRLVVDVRGVDGASSMFVRVLAEAVTGARHRGCVVSTLGLVP